MFNTLITDIISGYVSIYTLKQTPDLEYRLLVTQGSIFHCLKAMHYMANNDRYFNSKGRMLMESGKPFEKRKFRHPLPNSPIRFKYPTSDRIANFSINREIVNNLTVAFANIDLIDFVILRTAINKDTYIRFISDLMKINKRLLSEATDIDDINDLKNNMINIPKLLDVDEPESKYYPKKLKATRHYCRITILPFEAVKIADYFN